MGQERVKSLAANVSKLDYYESQKGWVSQVMKRDKQLIVFVNITKPAVGAKVKKEIKEFCSLLEPPTSTVKSLQDM